MTQLLNISAEDAEEYTEALTMVLSGAQYFATLGADSLGIPEALGLSREEWGRRVIGGGRVWRNLDERRQLSVHLTTPTHEGGAGLSNVKAAEALGVDEGTVRNDKRKVSESSETGSSDDQYEQVRDAANKADSESSEEPLWPGDAGQSDEVLPVAESPESEAKPVDEPLEPTAPGWHKLGPHLLYCGDSTDPEFIEACKGTFAFADPPYNAGKAEWDAGFEWEHDYLIEAADIVAVTPGIAALKGFHTVTAMPYQWSIAAEITNGMTRGALGFGNWIYVALFSNGSLYRNAKDYLRVPAHTNDDKGGGHAARKPIRLLTELIGLFTSKGDTVIDPFLGSGTTLIAADRLERHCIGAELDPMHCADIIRRYESGTT